MKKDNSKKKERRLISAALPYINNVPHLGHIVGSHLPADIFARYCRLKGYETIFVGGTDENGSTSEIAAFKLNIPLKKFSDKLYEEHRKIYKWFGISYDNFSRTTREVHHETVKEFFKEVNKNKYIEKGKMKVFYSPLDNMFLPDRYVVGECPVCGYQDASGDQCEKCTSVLDPSQLKNPKSTISGSRLEIREVEHLFLKLDALSSKLKRWINSQRSWREQVKNLAMGWINEGLKPRCITRDLKHGVSVPMKGFEEKVFYVWFDAPIGYISSTKEATKDWKKFWKDKKSKIYNFLGKDNIPFHTIFWPGMIIAHRGFNLPENVIGLQYLNFEGKKFSKSKGIGVFCERLPEIGLDADVWRHYLTLLIPESSDTEFRWKDFQERVNSDLIGNYANYTNRVLNFIYTKLNGRIKKPALKNLKEIDKNLLKSIADKKITVENLLEKADLRRAYSEILELSTIGNKYINDSEPWNVIKENPERANDIFYNCAVLLKALSILFSPYLPGTSERVWKQLNINNSFAVWNWEDIGKDFGEEHQINKPELLFKKLENKQIEEYKDKTSKGTDLTELFKNN